MILITCFSLSCTKVDTKPDSLVRDYDGNMYKTKTIGTQMWMLEDLRCSHYNNGDLIANHTSTLYTFYEVQSDMLCPLGWHIPQHWEWYVLDDYFTKNDITPDLGNLGYWWSSSPLIEGYETVQAWSWYQNIPYEPLTKSVELKEKYLSVRCIKD